ncbi:MAG TPA: class I SAM-dependent methyltransferase [Candidatus Paceibacterota bacterium]|nr:class I SAM-dependent methyltransferase [Candidatus Paceibacterota bacterium]
MSKLLRKTRSFLAFCYLHSPFFSEERYFRFPVGILKHEMEGKASFEIIHIGSQKRFPRALWEKICKQRRVGNITVVENWETSRGLPKNFYDFAYVDDGHSYSATRSDILHASELLHEGGVLAGDDLELSMDEVDARLTEQCREDNHCKDPRSGMEYHPGVTFAIGEILGNSFSRDRAFWAARRMQNGWGKYGQ